MVQVIGESKRPIKMWTDHVPVEEDAKTQLMNVANMPFIHRHLAVMPDVHVGKGATVGSVIPTSGAIIPSAVGVDIGCGMQAAMLNIKAKDLPDNLHQMRTLIETLVPHGRTNNGGPGDKGAHSLETLSDIDRDTIGFFWAHTQKDIKDLFERHPKALSMNHINHMGTLGGGNHFIEICLDLEDNVWIMLHSGSRGYGNRIGSYFIEKAKEEMERYFISLADKDLSYLVEGTSIFNDYQVALHSAQEFARFNRVVMFGKVLNAIKYSIPHAKPQQTVIECHHNYVNKEYHFGKDVWVTRKGAVEASEGKLGIIPGSMGARSFIVRGKGNAESFCSCSHGAGRVMSRTQATKLVSLEQHILDTQGIECKKDESVLDETPKAYKNIVDVMKSQEDLVEIVTELRQVLCVKG